MEKESDYIEINLSELDQGIYFIKASNLNDIRTIKLIKKWPMKKIYCMNSIKIFSRNKIKSMMKMMVCFILKTYNLI